ncbi:MAG TPA: GDSL family lipase [Cytophagales bacterium]|nr:GDSL family lipase [Cytophagales bacterium]
MKKIFFVLVMLPGFSLIAQTKPSYWDDVQAIKKYDLIYDLHPNPILFVGSSSIRKWERLPMVFGQYNVLNRGIGGAVINDIIFYLNDLVFAYQPRQIVLFVGENDLPVQESTVDSIVNRTKRLHRMIRAKLPTTPIIYISFKPSPSRDQYMDKAKAAIQKIKEFYSTQPNVTYLDVYSMMLKDGKSRPELFVSDQLHMNEKGYKMWEKALRPHLLKH